MATLRLSFAQSDYNHVLSGKTNITTLLSKILKSEPAFSKIIEHLSAYHSPDGGSIEINDFEVSGADYNAQNKKGQVKITYRIYYFYGCADITKDAGDHETWNFDMDTTGNTLILYMPEYDRRSTVDEF